MITATELLDFLCKAQKLHSYDITFLKVDNGYFINVRCDWYNDKDYHIQSTFISNEGESTWDSGDYEFYTMNNILDEKLEEQLQKEIKAQKRQELIDSLTPEQRELLGVQ